MKRFRSSQITKILGLPVRAHQMHRFGLPYLGAAGTFSEATHVGSIDLMLAAAEAYPKIIHPVSFMENGWAYNRYVDGAFYYQLYFGNSDPDIEFTDEFLMEDFPPGQIESEQRKHQEMMLEPPTLATINAIQWQFERFQSKRKKA